ncbi:MAG: hypothetical protein IIW54_08410 [Lachnospiraceae bacterium]|nr:hypothetical protein [Lachnospiraceae bacterium]MBQ2405804.1 hypothetical protein [Lachnospiraceae bacterium]MBQ5850817.1 hypothetical protein [Lachnospiraceae bacterium]MEE0920763.1 hypothetical protein [Lachnospiraceae bacterium]
MDDLSNNGILNDDILENEMEILEENIIKNYNEFLKVLLDEGDIDTLQKVITDNKFRREIMDKYYKQMKKR